MRRSSALLILMFVAAGSSPADDFWPEWRGVGGHGHGAAKNLPVSWSEDDNVRWKRVLPGRGHSTPVIRDGRIWLTTAIDVESSKETAALRRKETTNNMPLRISDSVSLRVLCIDLKSGKQLHDVEVLTQRDPQMIYFENTYATPSPIIDKDRLYCHFGPNGFVCLDLTTLKKVWENRDLVVKHENGAGGSPVLWRNLLIVHCDGIDQQYVVALDKNTGDEVWKTPRSGKKHSNPQLRKAYATPLIVELHGRAQVVSPGADWMYGYDAATGQELWRVNYGDLGFSNSARPVFGNGLIYVCTGYMKSRLLAVKVDPNNKATIAWEYLKQVPSVSSPILVGDKIYFGSDRGIISCVDATSGETVWTERAGARFWAAPMFADGRLHFFDRGGSTVVLEPGPSAKVVSKNKLNGEFFASGVPVEGGLILRTDKALYRVGR